MNKKALPDKRNVGGVMVEAVAPDMYAWMLGTKQTWTYTLWGRKLHCMGELVCEGIMTLAHAVTFAKGYETAVCDMVRKAERERMAKELNRQRGDILPYFPELDGGA